MVNKATQKLLKIEKLWCDGLKQQREFNVCSYSVKILSKPEISVLKKYIIKRRQDIKKEYGDSFNDEDAFGLVRNFAKKYVKSNPFTNHNAYLCYLDEDNHYRMTVRPLTLDDIPEIKIGIAQFYSNIYGDLETFNYMIGMIKIVAHSIRIHHTFNKVVKLTNIDSNVLRFVVTHPRDAVIKSLSFNNALKLLNYYNLHLIDNYERDDDLVFDKDNRLTYVNYDENVF